LPGALRAFAERPATSAVLTDFDGTLAPIVPDPADAQPLPGAADLLAGLAAVFRTVGVISGRPASFLVDRLGGAAPNVVLAGLYGLERVEGGEVGLDARALPWVGAVREVALAAADEAPPGVGVEPKGASLTLHWRQAPQEARWAEDFGRRWADRSGLALQPGRMALELRPPVAVDKGVVVEELAKGASAACFAGDDLGDLAAFGALDRLQDRGVAVARIAVSGPECPSALQTAADLVLAGPEAFFSLLQRLLDAVKGS
jgi:trehalose 6-phosphate phosphatase